MHEDGSAVKSEVERETEMNERRRNAREIKMSGTAWHAREVQKGAKTQPCISTARGELFSPYDSRLECTS